MASIFDKYKPTSTTTVKKIMEEEDAATSFNKRSGRLELSDGLNKIRIGPKHPGEDSFMHIHGCHWITIQKEDGEPGRRTVQNARLHANIKQDPIEAYVDFCKTKLATGEQEDTDKIKLLTDYKTGLNLSTTWLSYGKLIKGEHRGAWELFEYKRSVRDALKSSMIIEDEDEAIEADPFTDPLTGRCILLTYNSKAKKSTDYYKVQIAEKKTPITEDEMIAYDKLTPISKLPEVNYTMKDFELALEGLEYYDEEHDINLFADEEFQGILKTIKKQLVKKADGIASDVENEEVSDELPFDEDEKPKKKVVGKVVKEKTTKKEKIPEPEEEDPEEESQPEEDDEDKVGSDKFSKMDREELKIYKAEKEYDIKLFKNDTDEDIRNKLREAEAAAGEDPDPEPEEEDDEPVAVKKAPTKPKLTLEEIKRQMKAKNK